MKFFRRKANDDAPATVDTEPMEQNLLEGLRKFGLEVFTVPKITKFIGGCLYYMPQDSDSRKFRRHILLAVHTAVNEACPWIKVDLGNGGLIIDLRHAPPRRNVNPTYLDSYLLGVASHAPSYEEYPSVYIVGLRDHAYTLTINHLRDGYVLDTSNGKHLSTPMPVASIEGAITLIREEKL